MRDTVRDKNLRIVRSLCIFSQINQIPVFGQGATLVLRRVNGSIKCTVEFIKSGTILNTVSVSDLS